MHKTVSIHTFAFALHIAIGFLPAPARPGVRQREREKPFFLLVACSYGAHIQSHIQSRVSHSPSIQSRHACARREEGPPREEGGSREEVTAAKGRACKEIAAC